MSYRVRLFPTDPDARHFVPPRYLGAHFGLGPELRPMPAGLSYCYDTPEDAEAAAVSANFLGWTWKVEVL